MQTDELHVETPYTGNWASFVLFIQLGTRRKSIEAFTLAELSLARRHYFGLFVMLMMYPSPVIACSVFYFPAFRSLCVNCPLTVEFILVVMASASLFFGIVLGVTYTLWKMKPNDPQLVRKELTYILVYGTVWVYLGYGMELGDPSALQYRRIFNWRLILSVGPFVYCAISVLFPLWLVRQYQAMRITSQLRASRQENWKTSPEFLVFIASRYCSENVNFILDVDAFMLASQTKSHAWKIRKTKQVIRTYIADGADQQVNISSKQRLDITSKDMDAIDEEELESVFHVAYKEIEGLITGGLYIDFLSERSRDMKSKRVVTV
jgi:hypothetical protein